MQQLSPRSPIGTSSKNPRQSCLWTTLCLLALAALAPAAVRGQGYLTVTPGRTVSTAVGTGAVGNGGDGGAATAASLASPSAVAYDSVGNLYVADALNHSVREVVKTSGNVVILAGSGVAGFAGDGGAATSALLDTPTGIAVDAAGNLYIADSHNHRVRKVTNGTITTIAGIGVAGFSGDGGAATAAALSLPSAVAVDSTGNLYIADTDNQRIRKVSGTIISTIAGTDEQTFSGDGAVATAATLDSPTGVAVDAAGNIYIADRHNQRVRVINGTGIISTLAGSGAANFAGGFSGDGASATSAVLSKPSGVSVDSFGNVYIADTNNQRIRQVNGTSISTISGTGNQGFGGDGGPATAALLNAPKAVATDATGNLVIADTLNQRVRSEALPVLSFTGVAGASPSQSTPQTVTLGNSGSSAITVSSVSYTGSFSSTSGGTCPAAPIALAPGASCTQNILYTPAIAGSSSGSVAFSGAGIATQTVVLNGTASVSTTSLSLVSSNATPFINAPVTYTATVSPAANAGTVSFYNGATLIGTVAVTAGQASITTSFATAGTYTLTATYSGATSFLGSTSAALTQVVNDFNFTLTPDPSNPATGADYSVTVIPGGSGVFNFLVQPLNGPFTFPITLSTANLPTGFTATFAPQTLTLGANPAKFTMTVQTPKQTAALRFGQVGGVVMALLVLPFAGALRRRGLQRLTMCVMGVGSLAALAALSGCGTGTGFFGQPSTSYTIQVVATAQSSSGATLQHTTSVKLVVQ